MTSTPSIARSNGDVCFVYHPIHTLTRSDNVCPPSPSTDAFTLTSDESLFSPVQVCDSLPGNFYQSFLCRDKKGGVKTAIFKEKFPLEGKQYQKPVVEQRPNNVAATIKIMRSSSYIVNLFIILLIPPFVINPPLLSTCWPSL
jgi:hypothetical protein